MSAQGFVAGRISIDSEISGIRNDIYEAKAKLYVLENRGDDNSLAQRVLELEKFNVKDIAYTTGIVIAIAVGLLL